jgi:hypothetical protein
MRLALAYFVLFTLPVCVLATWCALDGALGSARTLVLGLFVVTMMLRPMLRGPVRSRSHVRQSVAAGSR